MLIFLWWLLFSRAPWLERFGALVLMVAGVAVTSRFVDRSIANGLMSRMLPILSIPVLGLALVVWAVVSRRMTRGPRWAALVVAIAIGCGTFTMIRTGGITGDAVSDFHWRWTPTPEQRLLAQMHDEPAPLAPVKPIESPATATTARPSDAAIGASRGESPSATPAAVAPKTSDKIADKTTDKTTSASSSEDTAHETKSAIVPRVAEWPGFRGPDRNGVVRGVQIKTDWSTSPPVRMWQRPIGPGWSSFAVAGDVLYTQEQRGNDEIVAAYKVTTGEPVWRHRDATRFYESNGGAGPRGTPTLSDGRLYSLGATGILNALDARTGAVLWSRNAGSDAHVKTPGWGFSSSPLITNDLVIVAASGALQAYDRATGAPRWNRKSTGGSYSSPQLFTIDGVPQIVLLQGAGATSVSPVDGKTLWEFAWEGVPIIQPAITTDGNVLVTTGDAMGGNGMRRLALAHGPSGWTTDERWMSTALKPYFNDYVVHQGHAYGFDGSILACVDLVDGKRKWKGGRYGHGQLVLLPDQDLLLVLSEEGELALVKATPDQFTELARVPAIEGKTWNHPVVVHDVLLVRNGEEMAAFRLSLETR
jgi:outer membrane protein assembly factor BamB